MKIGDTVKYIKTGAKGVVFSNLNDVENDTYDVENDTLVRKATREIHPTFTPIWALVKVNNSLDGFLQIVCGHEKDFIITRQLLIEKKIN